MSPEDSVKLPSGFQTFMSLNRSLNSFKQDEYGFATNTDMFEDPGTYTYHMALYDCDNIMNDLGKECKDISREDLSGITPLAEVSKSVIVTGQWSEMSAWAST